MDKLSESLRRRSVYRSILLQEIVAADPFTFDDLGQGRVA